MDATSVSADVSGGPLLNTHIRGHFGSERWVLMPGGISAVQYGRAHGVTLCWERPYWIVRRHFGPSCRPVRRGGNSTGVSKIFHPGLFHLCSCSATSSVAFQYSRLQSSDLTLEVNQSQARPKQNGRAHSLSDPFLCRRKDVAVLGRLVLRDREMGSVCRQDAG